jgi:hypothetical protein
MLIVKEPDAPNWHVMRLDRSRTRDKKTVFDGCFVYYADGLPRTHQQRKDVKVGITGPTDYLKTLEHANELISELRYASSLPLVSYLTLMLNSKTTEVTREPAPAKLNKHRLAKGKTPLPAHRVVTIVPLAYRTVARGGGTHASPRLHWRRSHKRHFEEKPVASAATWMPNEVWLGKAGWWVVVIPRFLVGKVELGEVSHEYRFIQPERKPLG